MAVERAPGGTSLIDVLDRVLDKGIVVDAWVRVSLVGIDLLTVEARIVVASIDTYLRYADVMEITATVARPPATGRPSLSRETLEPDEPEEPPAAAGVRSPLKPSPPTLSSGAAAIPPQEQDLPEWPTERGVGDAAD
jgi:gas vesicle structural protein